VSVCVHVYVCMHAGVCKKEGARYTGAFTYERNWKWRHGTKPSTEASCILKFCMHAHVLSLSFSLTTKTRW